MGKAEMENIQQPTSNTQHPMAVLCRDAATGRLPVATVERLHRLLGGEARVETMILRFIADRFGAKDLLHLSPHVASEILKRPADFIQAVKNHCEPQLNF
jgi:hypothetical protein